MDETLELPWPERCRELERPFGWAPCRMATGGWLARLSLPAKALYLGLCLVADRRGLSYFGAEKLQALCGLDASGLRGATEELVQGDLLATAGPRYQLLSLPSGPAPGRPAPPREVPTPPAGRPATPAEVAVLLAPLRARWTGRR